MTRAEVERVLDAWDIGPVQDVASDTLGTINRTWLVKTTSGRYAVRLSSHQDADALERECDLLSFAAAGGIPAIEPVLTRGGKPFTQFGGGLWMVSPFVSGYQIDREDMSPEQDRGMGRCLGRLIDVLSSCPEHLGKRRQTGVDVHRTLTEISRFESLIRSLRTHEEFEGYALDRLQGRRAWIEAHADATTDGLDTLTHQIIHGDFQEKNVFFDERGEVVGLIDWDNAWMAPPEWEIIRTLNFVMEFDPIRGANFVAGYRESADLDLELLDSAAWAYGVSRTHSLWLFEEIYERGNERARRFQRPGPFQPVYDRWIPLRDALQ